MFSFGGATLVLLSCVANGEMLSINEKQLPDGGVEKIK